MAAQLLLGDGHSLGHDLLELDSSLSHVKIINSLLRAKITLFGNSCEGQSQIACPRQALPAES
jgi:hypothetical protein